MLSDDFYGRNELTLVENDSDGERYLGFILDSSGLNIGLYCEETDQDGQEIGLTILQAKALRDFLNYALRDAR